MTEITRPFAPAPDKSTKAATEFAKDKKTKPYYFPRVVLLQLPSLERVRFEMGVQQVPEEVLNHEPSMRWLTDNGAKPHTLAAAAPQLDKMPAITEHHVRFLQSRGYAVVRTVADAIRFVTMLKQEDKAGFFHEAAEWKGPQSNESLDPKPPVTAAADPNDKPADAGDGEGGDDAENTGDPGDKADDKPGDKAISARASVGNTASDVTDHSKAAPQGQTAGKSAGAAGKPSGKNK